MTGVWTCFEKKVGFDPSEKNRYTPLPCLNSQRTRSSLSSCSSGSVSVLLSASLSSENFNIQSRSSPSAAFNPCSDCRSPCAILPFQKLRSFAISAANSSVMWETARSRFRTPLPRGRGANMVSSPMQEAPSALSSASEVWNSVDGSAPSICLARFRSYATGYPVSPSRHAQKAGCCLLRKWRNPKRSGLNDTYSNGSPPFCCTFFLNFLLRRHSRRI